MDAQASQKRRRMQANVESETLHADSLRAWSRQFPAEGTVHEGILTAEVAARQQQCGQSCVYTIRATLGEVPTKMPSWMTTCRKQVLVDILSKKGLDTLGTKPVLLERLRVSVPWVQYQIDARECVQRALIVALEHFEYNDEHLYEIKMPRRGSFTYGASRLKDIDDYVELYLITRRVGTARNGKVNGGSGAERRWQNREEASSAGAARNVTGSNHASGAAQNGDDARRAPSAADSAARGGALARGGSGVDADAAADDASCVSSTPCRCGACDICLARGDMSALSSMCIRRGLKVHDVLQWDWEALGDTRCIVGSAMEPLCGGPGAAKQPVRLEQLGLEIDDEMRVEYNTGNGNKLIMRVEAVETAPYVLPERAVMNAYPTRHRVLSSGGPKAPPQYGGVSEYNATLRNDEGE